MSLPNFHKVSNELYRGGQPDREGFKELVKMGVKTSINLRSFHTDYFYLRGLPLVNHHIWMKSWHPEMSDVDEFMKIYTIAKIKGQLPMFIHCQHGSDRTGTMCAVYRVKVMAWPKEAAIREMLHGPFGFHRIWNNLPKFVSKL